MKKNTLIRLIAVVVMCFVIGAVLVACAGETGPQGETGPAGPAGPAGAAGAAGANGANGADGLTPFIGENGNWWIGETDTGVAAAGKDGANGTNGANGANGEKGDKGDKGDDGLTPFIGENGNWWIGDEDTGVAAAGKDGAAGEKGDKGDDGLTPYIGENGNWWIGDEDTGVAAAGKDGADATDCENHVWDSAVLSEHYTDFVNGVEVAGITLYVCIECGDAKLVPTTHEYVETVYAPDCVNPGFTRYECSCGMYYDDNITAPVGHDLPAFDADNVDPAWVLDINTSGLCDCEWERTYTAHCLVCDEDVHEVGKAAGHVYTNYVPALNDTDLTACEWEPRDVADCDVCGHADCIDTIYYPAPGHDWAKWTIVTEPTVNAGGEIVRVCNRSGEIENKLLPALSEADYTYVDVAPTCTEDGTRTYTVVVDGQSFDFDVAIPATGHVLNEECAYEITLVPTFDADGEVVITCACGDKLTYVLPALANSRVYNIKPGNCGGVKDVYSFVVVADGSDYGECIVSFEVECAEEHSEAPAKENCTMVEGDDKYYWVYKCDKCGLWIVAYYANK